MKTFVKNTLFFAVVVIVPAILITVISYNQELSTNLRNDAVYIWGDSQTFQGIDIDILAKNRNQNIKSAACHGSGVYDFLVYAHNVPENACCIVAFSQCCLLRQKSSDYNRSGLDIKMLQLLYECHYSELEILQIIRNNLRGFEPHLFSSSHSQYAYCDTVFYAEPLNEFAKMYSNEPYYFIDKVELYRKGLDILMMKHCNVTIIEFPYYGELYRVSLHSSYRNIVDNERSSICNKYANGVFDTLYISDKDSLLMHDLTHMNEVGSRRLTEALCKYLDTCTVGQNHFIIVNGGKCN